MKRIIILDISGVYSQIYDEIYCDENNTETYDKIKKYSINPRFIVIELIF